MLHLYGTIRSNVTMVKSKPPSEARFTCYDFKSTSSVTAMLQKLQWDSLQQRRAHSRVLMLYRIHNGLVAIPASAYLQPATAHTTGSETPLSQCNTNAYNHTFFPTAICLWNTLPVDVCQLPPDSFAAQLNSTQSSWYKCLSAFFYPLHCTVFICSSLLPSAPLFPLNTHGPSQCGAILLNQSWHLSGRSATQKHTT